jgi:hypothetical protein
MNHRQMIHCQKEREKIAQSHARIIFSFLKQMPIYGWQAQTTTVSIKIHRATPFE